MSELHEIIPTSVPMEVDGKVWQFGPLRLQEHAEIDAAILAERPQPIDVAALAIAKLSDPALQKRARELAFAEMVRGPIVTNEERQTWSVSYKGRVMRNWFRLRQSYPHLSMDDVDQLFIRDGIRRSREEAAREADEKCTKRPMRAT